MTVHRILACAMLTLSVTAVSGELLELETQFGGTVRILGDGKPRIIVYADRDGSDQTDAWGQVLSAMPCPVVAAANLSAVPGFARSMVRDAFGDEDPIALDWEGMVAERLPFHKGEANVYLVDRAGEILTHTTGVPQEAAVKELTTLTHRNCRKET